MPTTFVAIVAILLAVTAGAAIVAQQALNANLKTALNSTALSGFMSYAVGCVCMALLIIVMRDPIPSMATVARIPWWAWSGGVFGAVFIGLGIVLLPQLGAATFLALVVAGQMFASVAFDHFGIFGFTQRSVDLPRLLGVALLVAGVILIRRP
jgi:transporter family-2 protein